MHISPLGWIAIIILVVVILVLNLGLIALLRNPTGFKINRPPRTQTGMTVQKLGDVIRDPFAEEKRQMNELNELVENLKDQSQDRERVEPEEDEHQRN